MWIKRAVHKPIKTHKNTSQTLKTHHLHNHTECASLCVEGSIQLHRFPPLPPPLSDSILGLGSSLTMAVSTTFSAPKFDSLFLKSSPSTQSHLSLLTKPRTTFIHKGIIRCDAQNNGSSSSSLSPLELLKTSSADSKSMLHSSYLHSSSIFCALFLLILNLYNALLVKMLILLVIFFTCY